METNSMLVVVLSDGETYTELKGCRILYVPPGIFDVDSFVENNYENGIAISPLIKLENIESYGDILIPDYENLDCQSPE
jgi:hypothetical protein